MDTQHYIAVDLGAESGRVMLGTVSKDNFTLEQVSRFGNTPLEVDGTLRWDFGHLLSSIKSGIAAAVKQSTHPVAGIGIDSWGVDFGLLDGEGQLIENPYHYRDARTNGMMERAFEMVDKRAVYEHTGLQFMQLNTIYQLLSMRLADYPALKQARRLLFTADLYAYFLCGRPFGEYTLASTSQLMDMHSGQWSKFLFEKLDLPPAIMPDPVRPGTVVGQLTDAVAAELGCDPIPVIAVGSHDTASAVAAVPAQGKNWAYLSCGTWSLMGVEVPDAIINDKTFEYEFTNEGGVEGTIRLLKNIMGLWVLQECRRQWQRDGEDLDYATITEMAEQAEPFAAFIDPDHSEFLAPGDMPARIAEYLKETGQAAISDKGQIARAILESLALKYRTVVERIEDITGEKIECLHMVGGGIQNELLCQFTADAIGRTVIAGPVEATASGNILMQAKAAGQVRDLDQIRQLVRNSFELKTYRPQDTQRWQNQYQKIQSM